MFSISNLIVKSRLNSIDETQLECIEIRELKTKLRYKDGNSDYLPWILAYWIKRKHNLPVKIIESPRMSYLCVICKRIHSSLSEAIKCVRQHYPLLDEITA